MHRRACKRLCIPDDIICLVTAKEFRKITGCGSDYCGMEACEGIGSHIAPIYWIHKGATFSTYLHEILEVIFRLTKPHWWIYATAWKFAGKSSNFSHYERYGGYGSHIVGYPDIARLPSKNKLLQMINKAYNKRCNEWKGE